MEIDGELIGFDADLVSNKAHLSLKCNNGLLDICKSLQSLKNKPLTVNIKQKRNKRSIDANALMWKCIQELAFTYQPPKDTWSIYLEMLKKYGQFTYVMIEPDAVEMMQRAWRETEIVGEMTINGHQQIQMICFFGSSTYNTREFALLLDGIIAEMVAEGLNPPSDEEKWRALEKWANEEKHSQHHQ